MIAPSARMMLLEPPYAGKRLRKLRFLMTDNTKISENVSCWPVCSRVHE
jgi:hypothetical protein